MQDTDVSSSVDGHPRSDFGREDAARLPTHVPIIPASEVALEEIPIGRGGYGTVYRGRHQRFGSVAVKTLIENGMLPDKHVKLLKKEAKKLLEVCQHPSILKLLGLIMEKDNYSLILEYMALGSLFEFRKEFSVQWPLMVRITWDVVSGMEFLHSQKPQILHLDLKADNILLNGQLRAKIADFGLSEWRTVTMTVTRRTDNAGRRCTVSHVPPEVWSNVNLPGNSQYDIYSFGIVMWEMLTGAVPYGTSSDDLVRSAVLCGQRPDFSLIPGDCPSELIQKMTRCWHQKPVLRPTFGDLKKEVQQLYDSKFSKDIIKALKNIRSEILEEYETDDPVYMSTAELDNLPEPVDMELESSSEPTPGGSGTSNPTTTGTTASKHHKENDNDSDIDDEESTPPNIKLFKTDKDMNPDDRMITKILHHPLAMRMAKWTDYSTLRSLFSFNENVHKVLKSPKRVARFLQEDIALKWEMKYFKYDIYHELSGSYLKSLTENSRMYIALHKDEMESRTYGMVYSDPHCYSQSVEDEKALREKRKKKVEDVMYQTHFIKNKKTEGDSYRLKKAMESASQLQQALKDRESGDSSLKLSTIDPEVLDIAKNPYVLLPCLYEHDDLLCTLCRHYPDLFLKLVSEAKATGRYSGHNHMGPSRARTSMSDMPRGSELDMMMMEEMMMMGEMGPRGRMMPHRMMFDDDSDDEDTRMTKMMRMHALMKRIEPIGLADDQYSYHHAKIFGVFNHLFLDHWAPTNVYFVDKNWTIIRATSFDMSVDVGRKVLQIPDAANQKLIPGRLNPTVQFVSADLAVLSDGAGKFHLIETGNRADTTIAWKIIFSKDIVNKGEPFLLVDAVLHSEEENHHIECLCVHVSECSEEQRVKYRSPYITVLDWVTLTSVDKKIWSIGRTRQLVGRRPFDYAAIDHVGSSVIVSSEAEFKFVSDSEKAVHQEDCEDQNNSQTGEIPPEYTWQQTNEDVSVQFTLPADVSKADIYLSLTSEHIDFGIKNSKALLKGNLHTSVDVEASTWTKSGQKIELTLGKMDQEVWPIVVVGDSRGEMTYDSTQIAEIHERLAHLTSEQLNPDPEPSQGQAYNAQELEDCDRFPDDSSSLMRIDGNTHRILYHTNLGSHQLLFSARLDKDKPPALCLRHDVDGLIWQPENIVKEKQLPWQHNATFNAFGYVQASKQQRKYSACPPSCTYSVICDCSRHVYLYRQPSAISSPVRNRKTGRQINTVAKQQVIALESVDSIIGLQATNDKLFVTTKNMLYVVNVGTDV